MEDIAVVLGWPWWLFSLQNASLENFIVWQIVQVPASLMTVGAIRRDASGVLLAVSGAVLWVFLGFAVRGALMSLAC